MSDLVFCLRFLAVTAWRDSRRRVLIATTFLLLGGIAAPLAALALRSLTDAALAGATAAAQGWALLAAFILIAQLMLGHVAFPYYFEASEMAEAGLNRRLMRLLNGSRGLERTDDPAFTDGLELMRQDIARSRGAVQAAMQLLVLAVQVTLTAVVLASVAPPLLLLLVLALVPVLAGRRAEDALEQARLRSAPLARQVKHLRDLAVDAKAQQEIRLSRAGQEIRTRHTALQAELTTTLAPGFRRYAFLRGMGQLAFALAYLAAVLIVYLRASSGRATPGEVVLVIVLATQVSGQISTGLGLMSTISATANGLRRLTSLEAASAPPQPELPLPPGLGSGRLTEGILLDRVEFTYPGATRPVLKNVSLRLPAGQVVAIVGENGAGKSTLIKILTALYTPTGGRVFLDGANLDDLSAAQWRERTATLFQDFAQFHLTFRESVGLGSLPDLEVSVPQTDRAVRDAVHRAEAHALLRRLNDDPGSLIGRGYGDGTDLSGGQWQSVAFSRAMMRREPLLLCLDEPGHALDPMAEQRTVDAYGRAAREIAVRCGGVTIFVTHRLSTVRMADLVVFLSDGTVTETGTHGQLVAAGGEYAQLWALQSAAYD
jgi:ATP-binding cassette subfamily B protein